VSWDRLSLGFAGAEQQRDCKPVRGMRGMVAGACLDYNGER